MIPKARLAALLALDAALDTLAVELYRAENARRRASLQREADALRDRLRTVLGDQTIRAGDFRR